jgi:hypothetical protein
VCGESAWHGFEYGTVGQEAGELVKSSELISGTSTCDASNVSKLSRSYDATANASRKNRT